VKGPVRGKNGGAISIPVLWVLEHVTFFYSRKTKALYEEAPSLFEPEDAAFSLLGLAAHMGGTCASNINWNSGCIFCLYSCVCGITSNSKANENTWFADGGTYDMAIASTNYYAGRYYPRMDILPGTGTAVKIQVKFGKAMSCH
jgi:hypothetical protein